MVEIGDIIRNVETNIRYRVVGFTGRDVVLCTMDTTRFELTAFSRALITTMMHSREFMTEHDKPLFFDPDELDEKVREDFEGRRRMVREVEEQYGPGFLGLAGKRPKPEVKRIIAAYGVSSCTFWRVVRKYLQSGRRECSLVDGRHFSADNRGERIYKAKPGRRSETDPDGGVVRTPEIIAILDDMTKEYLSNPEASYDYIYDLMLNRYFLIETEMDGAENIDYAPTSECPTPDQLKYYIRTHSDRKQRRIAKTSVQEFRNDERPLVGDPSLDAQGPGDIVEIDAWEADASLLSVVDGDQSVGRATVYIMVDEYTRAIVAISVGYEVNSNLGLTSLFMNLGDDKQEYCRWFGVKLGSPDLWPSNFLPARIRVDRGSEMKSRLIEELCVKTGINKDILPGAAGSMKGLAESIFHQLKDSIRAYLVGHGLITDRHDSKHHEQATLDIEEFTKIVIFYVLEHNRLYMDGFQYRKEFKDAGVEPVPCDLWKYGTGKYGPPHPITVQEQYLFDLMMPVKAKITRRGLEWDGLCFLPDNDPQFAEDMLSGKKKAKTVHIDPRTIRAVYYVKDGQIITARLNTNMAKYQGLKHFTLRHWDVYRKEKQDMDKQGKRDNRKITAYTGAVTAAIIGDAEKEGRAGTKNMRAARAAERDRLASSNTIPDRLESMGAVEAAPHSPALPGPEGEPPEMDAAAFLPHDGDDACGAIFEELFPAKKEDDKD